MEQNRYTSEAMYWTSIEIFNGPFAARLWADAHADLLIETALGNGAIDWNVTRTAWGVAFEVAFESEAEWLHYKTTDAFRTALGDVPDPKAGVLIYRGRSLDGGTLTPRKPKPKAGSGSNALSLPLEPFSTLEALPALFGDAIVDRRSLVGTR